MNAKIFIILILATLSLNGCQSNEKNVYEEQNSKIQVDDTLQETNSTDFTAYDDLVYREYSLGTNFHSGEIIIREETLLNVTNEPNAVIVYFNDKILETIYYNNADIQVNLVNDGMYCFMVVDKNDTLVDITSQIQGTSYVEDGTVYLK